MLSSTSMNRIASITSEIALMLRGGFLLRFDSSLIAVLYLWNSPAHYGSNSCERKTG